MRSSLAIFLSLATLSMHTQAEEVPTKTEEPTKEAQKPDVKKIGPNQYQLGKITFNSAKGTLSFPATLEHNEVLIEYLLTGPQGKIHEALFVSEISPFNLNVVMKLLGYQESKELLTILDEDYVPTNKFYTSTEEQKKQSRFSISASWTVDGKPVSYNATQLLQHSENGTPMPDSPWIYHGSYMNEGKFKAQLSGDIIAIFTDRGSIANFSGEGRDNDELWVPARKHLPALGTPLTITFTKKHPKKP